MTYNDIKPTIKKVLDEEKIRLVSEYSYKPNSLYSSIDKTEFVIITAPFNFEAMQVVGEYAHDKKGTHFDKTYVVVGNAVKLISQKFFLDLVNDNCDDFDDDVDFYNNNYPEITNIYLNLLAQYKGREYKEYIDLCLAISTLRNKRKHTIDSFKENVKTKTF